MSKYVALVGPIKNTPFRKWVYNISGFRKYGLMLNDIYDDDTQEVREAVRRLPAEVYDARRARIDRAFQLSSNKAILPKNLWTKYEEDIKYLEPYLEEVKRELAEKKSFKHNNYETE